MLRLSNRDIPVAGAGELLIRVAASGVNRPDVLQRTGNYPVPPGASDVPGLEVAGRIESGDAQAMASAGFKIGDRVSIGSRSIILYDTEIGNDVNLDSLSLVMKGEVLSPGTNWGGSPIRPV